MPAHPPYDQATNVAAVHGEVTLSGPDGIGLSMTPAAAKETARRLDKAADEAALQAKDEADPDEI